MLDQLIDSWLLMVTFVVRVVFFNTVNSARMFGMVSRKHRIISDVRKLFTCIVSTLVLHFTDRT
jgi:DNA integrity scanning protein DisA with diadenylate cyclase activity